MNRCAKSKAERGATSFVSALGGSLHRAAEQCVTPRAWLLAAAHAVVFAAAYWLAYLLRFDFAVPEHDFDTFWSTLGWVSRDSTPGLRSLGTIPRLVALRDLRRPDGLAPSVGRLA